MRILWVKVGGLWPVNSGGRLRSYHLIAQLAQRHEVTVVTTHSKGESEEALVAQLPQCEKVVSVPLAAPKHTSWRFVLALVRSWFSPLPVDLYKHRWPALRHEVATALASGEFDLCVADFLTAIPNLPKVMPVPVLFFEHNVEYIIWRRLLGNETAFLRRAALALEWRKMRRQERSACSRSAMTVAVSKTDGESLRALGSYARIQTIPTGVDTAYFAPGKASVRQPKELVFTGSMDWHPNDDAMRYFIDEILPIIRLEKPAVTLTVAGRNPPLWLRNLPAGCGVTVTGTVADIRPWIERAAVYIVPLRIGGGTRLKIFEALAMGKAVISTTIGAEGLPLEENVQIVRADTAQRFAEQVLALLDDPTACQRLGRAGRHLMETQYAWPRVADVFEHACRSAVKSSVQHETGPFTETALHNIKD